MISCAVTGVSNPKAILGFDDPQWEQPTVQGFLCEAKMFVDRTEALFGEKNALPAAHVENRTWSVSLIDQHTRVGVWQRRLECFQLFFELNQPFHFGIREWTDEESFTALTARFAFLGQWRQRLNVPLHLNRANLLKLAKGQYDDGRIVNGKPKGKKSLVDITQVSFSVCEKTDQQQSRVDSDRFWRRTSYRVRQLAVCVSDWRDDNTSWWNPWYRFHRHTITRKTAATKESGAWRGLFYQKTGLSPLIRATVSRAV